MGLIEVKKDFTRRELMLFGPFFVLFNILVGGILWWRHGTFGIDVYSIWGGIVGLLVVAYYVIPPLRRPLYLGWLYAVFPIGFVISHVILIIIYYLVITPVGLLMRIVGYDPMHRKFDSSASSYWVPRDEITDNSRYFKQF